MYRDLFLDKGLAQISSREFYDEQSAQQIKRPIKVSSPCKAEIPVLTTTNSSKLTFNRVVEKKNIGSINKHVFRYKI